MRYTVFNLEDELGKEVSGLSLTEAFSRIMAMCAFKYRFAREGEAMKLVFSTDEPIPKFPDRASGDVLDPELLSLNPNDVLARQEIMQEAIRYGFRAWCALPDQHFAEERRKFLAQGSETEFATDVPRVSNDGTGFRVAVG